MYAVGLASIYIEIDKREMREKEKRGRLDHATHLSLFPSAEISARCTRGEIIESKGKRLDSHTETIQQKVNGKNKKTKKKRRKKKISNQNAPCVCAGDRLLSICSLSVRLPPLDRSLEMDEMCGRRWETERSRPWHTDKRQPPNHPILAYLDDKKNPIESEWAKANHLLFFYSILFFSSFGFSTVFLRSASFRCLCCFPLVCRLYAHHGPMDSNQSSMGRNDHRWFKSLE